MSNFDIQVQPKFLFVGLPLWLKFLLNVAVTPNGASVYVANAGFNSVSVIKTGTNTVTTVAVGANPLNVAMFPSPQTARVLT
jgi:YVTN family beta-propeller protein